MKKNRILSAILALCLCFSLGVTAFATGTVIQVEQPEELPAVGETFTVTVSISGNTGFNAAQFQLNYDDAVVECTSAEVGKVLQNSMYATNPHATNPSAAIVAAATTNTLKADGVVAVFEFVVLKSGNAKFALADVSFTNVSGNELQLTTDITEIKSDEEASEEEAKDEEEEEDETEDEAEAEEITPTSTVRFSDVSSAYWAHDYIQRAVNLGIITGFSDGTFRPKETVTRAQFVTMLWRMAGKPTPTTKHSFADVTAAWCSDAVSWAAENGYVTGVTSTTFNPNGKITRQQAMAILFRFNGGVSGVETLFVSEYNRVFTDSGDISSYAKNAVYWGVYRELITGKTTTTLAPKATATRTEIAVIFLRYYDKFILTSQEGTGV